jgi:hypothetical protein
MGPFPSQTARAVWLVCFGLAFLGLAKPRPSEVTLTSRSSVLGDTIPLYRDRQSVKIVVKSSAVAGPPGLYTYAYSVTADSENRRGVDFFGVSPVAVPDSMAMPEQWIAGYGYLENSRAAIWACADTLTPPPVDENLSDWSSPFEIQPGETKVFTMVSRHPPTEVTFYAQGFDSLPEVETYFEEDYPGEVNTAGYPEYPSPFRTGVTGRAIGPSPNN